MVERLSIDKIRFFRVERTYAVMTGKWYFEFEAVTGGDMRVGWARPGCKPDVELGTDELAFVFDGYRVSCRLDLNQSQSGHSESFSFTRKHFLSYICYSLPLSVFFYSCTCTAYRVTV